VKLIIIVRRNSKQNFSLKFIYFLVKIELRAPIQFQVGFEVICTEAKVPNTPGEFHKTDSGSYRSGFCVLTLDNIPGGTYTIRPATYDPKRESKFLLHIASSHQCTLTELK
jgi:calpain-7